VDAASQRAYGRIMSDYSSPSPEDEVEGTASADDSTSTQGTENTGTDDNVKAGSGTDEDTVSGGAPEPPD
jgi:hypothetical protein